MNEEAKDLRKAASKTSIMQKVSTVNWDTDIVPNLSGTPIVGGVGAGDGSTSGTRHDLTLALLVSLEHRQFGIKTTSKK